MNFTNYLIKTSKGRFYTSSKTPMEGYTANEYQDKETKENKTNYHKEVDTLSGILYSVSLKDGKFGERFTIALNQPNGDCHTLEIPVFLSAKGDIDGFLKDIARSLQGLALGANTEIFLNSTKKDKNGYLYKNVNFRQDGQKIDWTFSPYGEDSPVPKPKQETHKVTKKETWNFDEPNAWYYEFIKDAVNNLTREQTPSSNGTQTEVPQNNAANTPAPAAKPLTKGTTIAGPNDASISDTVDDLPF